MAETTSKVPKKGAKTTSKPGKVTKPTQDTKKMSGVNIDAIHGKKGRPSKYNPEIARIICEQLSEGIPLRQICRENEGFPAWRTVYDWMGRDEELSASIARARDIGYDAIAEECLMIADTPQMGQKQVMGDDGATVTVEDMLGHRKLQIETRLKLLAKFHPSKYGDRVGVHGVAGEAPIKTEEVGSNVLFELIKNLEMTKRVS